MKRETEGSRGTAEEKQKNKQAQGSVLRWQTRVLRLRSLTRRIKRETRKRSVKSKDANSVGRGCSDLTWTARNVQALAREIKRVEEGELIPGWGNFILSNGMVTHTNPWHPHTPCVVWGEKEKRSSAEWCGSLCFSLSDLEALLDLNGMEWWGLSRLGSRAILMHTYASTPILLSNSIIHSEIENPPYPCHPTRYTESHPPMIYLSSGCLPPGPLHQFMSHTLENLSSQQGSLAGGAACILLHAYTEYTMNLIGTWYVISWKHSSAISFITPQASDIIFCHQSGIASSGFTLQSLAHGDVSWGSQEGADIGSAVSELGRRQSQIWSTYYAFTEHLLYAQVLCCVLGMKRSVNNKQLLCVTGAHGNAWGSELDGKIYEETMVIQCGKCGKGL